MLEKKMNIHEAVEGRSVEKFHKQTDNHDRSLEKCHKEAGRQGASFEKFRKQSDHQGRSVETFFVCVNTFV